MKFNYTISYIFETLVRSEKQLEEHIIKYGEESWPIVRNMLWINLRHIKRGNILKIQQENSSLQFRYINFKRYKLFLINAYRKISYFFSKKDFLKESEVIFFSNSIFLENKANKNSYNMTSFYSKEDFDPKILNKDFSLTFDKIKLEVNLFEKNSKNLYSCIKLQELLPDAMKKQMLKNFLLQRNADRE